MLTFLLSRLGMTCESLTGGDDCTCNKMSAWALLLTALTLADDARFEFS